MYKPLESNSNKIDMSTGGLSKTVKPSSWRPPILARASAQRLVSRKQCLKRTWGICYIKCLQSSKRAEAKILEYFAFATTSTIDFASSSTSTANMLWLTHRLRPSLRAQSSARKLVVIPILRANPATHPPLV